MNDERIRYDRHTACQLRNAGCQLGLWEGKLATSSRVVRIGQAT